jgi:hypothetical protein
MNGANFDVFCLLDGELYVFTQCIDGEFFGDDPFRLRLQ